VQQLIAFAPISCESGVIGFTTIQSQYLTLHVQDEEALISPENPITQAIVASVQLGSGNTTSNAHMRPEFSLTKMKWTDMLLAVLSAKPSSRPL
jgi:hypothetical protein